MFLIGLSFVFTIAGLGLLFAAATGLAGGAGTALLGFVATIAGVGIGLSGMRKTFLERRPPRRND